MLLRRKLRTCVEHHEGDEVRLTIPATADAVKIARVGAAGLGTRMGFSFSEVEELRLAVGEAAALLTDDTREDMLQITYDLQGDGLRVALVLVTSNGDTTRSSSNLPMLTTSVLDRVVDAWEIDPSGREILLFKVPTDQAQADGDDDAS